MRIVMMNGYFCIMIIHTWAIMIVIINGREAWTGKKSPMVELGTGPRILPK